MDEAEDTILYPIHCINDKFYLMKMCNNVYYRQSWNGVASETNEPYYNQNSRQSTNYSAYGAYPAMDLYSNNLLTQACQTEKYQLCPDPYDQYVYTYTLLEQKATTWASFAVNSQNQDISWRPIAIYSYLGSRTWPWPSFNFTNPAQNVANGDWQLTDSVSRYLQNGMVSEVAKPTASGGRVFATTVYGPDSVLPIAAVANARFGECGAFTGDYSTGLSPNYWDYDNGWEKGTTNTVALTTNSALAHFGQNAIHVITDYAATRNCIIYPGKDYFMTAWVKVISGSINMAANFWYANPGHENDWPMSGNMTMVNTNPSSIWATPISFTDCNGQWKLMEMEIPASVTSQLNNSNTCFARAWVGGDPGGAPFEAYIDDIRFYPNNAQVTTTYSDWQGLPLVSVDANCNPGQKITYDGFQRPISWSKIDKTKSAGDAGYATMLQQKSYSLMMNGIVITSPKNNAVYDMGNSVNIAWIYGKANATVTFSLTTTNGTVVQSGIISPVISSNGGNQSATWTTIPDMTAGQYRLEVTDASNPAIYALSPVFTIRGNAVYAPAKGTPWLAGTIQNIQWRLDGASAVDLYYFDGTAYQASSFASGVTGTSYQWNLPNWMADNPNAKIKIVNSSDATQYVESDVFYIMERPNFVRKYIYQLYGEQ
jgi:hypothetical protein